MTMAAVQLPINTKQVASFFVDRRVDNGEELIMNKSNNAHHAINNVHTHQRSSANGLVDNKISSGKVANRHDNNVDEPSFVCPLWMDDLLLKEKNASDKVIGKDESIHIQEISSSSESEGDEEVEGLDRDTDTFPESVASSLRFLGF